MAILTLRILLENENLICIHNFRQSNHEIDMDRMIVFWLGYKKLPFNFFDDEVTQNFFRIISDNKKKHRKKLQCVRNH